MKKLLIVVDYQNDFVNGALGCENAAKIEENLVDKIKEYRNMGDKGQIIFTMDTHCRNYMETIEGKNLPVPHCLEGEDGWNLYGNVATAKGENDIVFSKPTFGSFELAEYLRKHMDEFESVEFAGVVTNICVISNAVLAKAAMPEVPITICASCVASNDTVLENKSFDIMENLHMKVIR